MMGLEAEAVMEALGAEEVKGALREEPGCRGGAETSDGGAGLRGGDVALEGLRGALRRGDSRGGCWGR